MRDELLVDAGPGLALRCAWLRGGRLFHLEFDPPDHEPVRAVGAVLAARALRADSDMRASFLDGGAAGDLFLPWPPRLEAGARAWVQIVRPARGPKRPAVSAEPSLAGRWLVHLPQGAGVRRSRRGSDPVADSETEALLADLPGGWILRSAASAASRDELQAEAASLASQGGPLRGRVPPPGPVLPGPDALIRMVAALGAARPRAEVAGPALARRVTAALGAPAATGPAGLFEARDLEAALAALAAPRVPLAGGAALTIEPTAALVAVDVDSGPRGDAAAVNLEAVAEAMRQVRLRHLAGTIVIDLVGRPSVAESRRLVACAEAALAEDPWGGHVGRVSALGLLEVARTRRGPPLFASEPAP